MHKTEVLHLFAVGPTPVIKHSANQRAFEPMKQCYLTTICTLFVANDVCRQVLQKGRETKKKLLICASVRWSMNVAAWRTAFDNIGCHMPSFPHHLFVYLYLYLSLLPCSSWFFSCSPSACSCFFSLYLPIFSPHSLSLSLHPSIPISLSCFFSLLLTPSLCLYLSILLSLCLCRYVYAVKQVLDQFWPPGQFDDSSQLL